MYRTESNSSFIDHPRSGVAAWCIICVVSICLFVCVSVCLYVCQAITFENLDVKVHICTCGISPRVTFVCEGHRVKVKVTRAKKVENSYSRNVKLPLATPALANIEPYFCVQHGVFGYGGSKCNCHLCHVTGIEHAQLNAPIREWFRLGLEGNVFRILFC